MVEASEVDRAFAAAIAEARGKQAMTRAQLAAEMTSRGLDMHETTIGKIERGERRITIGEAVALSELLGLRLNSIFVAGKMRDLTVEVDRAFDRYLTALTLFANEAHGLSNLRDELAEAIARFDETGQPYVNQASASEAYASLVDLGVDGLVPELDELDRVIQDYSVEHD